MPVAAVVVVPLIRVIEGLLHPTKLPLPSNSYPNCAFRVV
jgi:hypothetical protein